MGQDKQFDRPSLQGRRNDVTRKQEELLVRLMEECAELQKECSKVLRWGWSSYNPHNVGRGNNAENFHREAGDVGTIYDRISKTLQPKAVRSPRQHSAVRRPRKQDARG